MSKYLRAYKAPDLKNRLNQYGNPPLLYKESFQNKHQAALRERQIKGFSKAKKQDLIKGLFRWVYTELRSLPWAKEFTLSEIEVKWDLLGNLLIYAPVFTLNSGVYPEQGRREPYNNVDIVSPAD